MRPWGESGASLIELMIVVGISMALWMATMTFMNNQFKTVAYLEDKMSRMALEYELRLAFSRSDWCENVLKGVTLPGEKASRDILNSVKGAHSMLTNQGGRLYYDRLELSGIHIKNNDLKGSQTCGTAEMTYAVRRTREGGGPSEFRPIQVILSL